MKPRDLERLEQLLAERATEGLGDVELLELRGLLMRTKEVDPDEWLTAAAAVDRVFSASTPPAELSPSLRERIRHQARDFHATRATRPSSQESGGMGDSELATTCARDIAKLRDRAVASAVPRRTLRFDYVGWAAAAAAIIIACFAWMPETEPEPRVALAQLLELDPNAIERPWAPTADGSFKGVTGKVVWSERLQRGFMVIRGGPVNNPSIKQYQLWIVDKKRDDNPVDGGVFDVAGADEQILPFHARLTVAPSVFALTEEKPGGVVVSKNPLLLVASVDE